MFNLHVAHFHNMTVASLMESNESGDRDDITVFAAFFMSYSGTVEAASISGAESNDRDVEEILAILEA